MSKVQANISATSVSATGSATSTSKITEELLVCRLCCLKYNVDDRRPMALRCVHTFCECCLEQLMRQQANDSQKQRRTKRQQLVCPTCDTVTPLGRTSSPASLPVNPSIMELLDIFDRRGPGDAKPNRSNEVTPGYSQVKVTTMTTGSHGHVNGFGNSDMDSSMSASMKTKKDKRYESNAVDFHSSANGNVDDSAGGPTSHVNWISTVNIGGSAPQQQQQQPRQPLRGSSSNPPHVTSAVTSVSTLKMTSQRALSNEASLSDGNVSPIQLSSAACGVAHKCCRCGLHPATVSVASSSQTKAPQKLCSDCWKQPSAHRKDEDQRRETTGSGDVRNATASTETKQPNDTGNRILTANQDIASQTLPTSARKTASQQVRGEPTATKSGASVVRDTRTLQSVASGKSTIEVRRRSSLAPTSTNETTTNNGSNHSGQSSGASATATPHRESETTRQRSTADRASPDAEHGAVVETMAAGLSNSSGSTGRNVAERSEHGVGYNTRSRRCSAPPIGEMHPIHPLPCDNPPYNPDFEESGGAARSSGEQQQLSFDTASWSSSHGGRLNLTLPEIHNHHEEHQQRMSTLTEKALGLSFLLPNSGRRYQVEQPPKYEDIIHETNSVAATAPEISTTTTQTRLQPAIQSPPSEPVAATPPGGMRLVRSFGKYGEISTQPGAFRSPGRVSVSSAASSADNSGTAEATSMSCRVVVADRANSTVQVFSETGECLSMLRADVVRGCCWLKDVQNLIVATDKGVEIYDINGSRLNSIPIGATLNVVPYKRSFIAVQSKSLSVFKGTSFGSLARTLTSKAKPGQFNRLLQFDDICDVAVNSQQDLVVLEATMGGLITVMADDGYVKSTISPAQLEACGSLKAPSAVAVDSQHNIVVSESGRGARILLFGANGRLQRALHGPASPYQFVPRAGATVSESTSSETDPWPAGLTVGPDDRLYVIMRGEKFAEIRVYQYL